MAAVGGGGYWEFLSSRTLTLGCGSAGSPRVFALLTPRVAEAQCGPRVWRSKTDGCDVVSPGWSGESGSRAAGSGARTVCANTQLGEEELRQATWGRQDTEERLGRPGVGETGCLSQSIAANAGGQAK